MDEKLIFKTYAGSKLYGTDSECSDTDIKGVFIPYKEDLILGKAPKHYSVSSNNQKEKNNKADIDETYYSIHYFLELILCFHLFAFLIINNLHFVNFS